MRRVNGFQTEHCVEVTAERHAARASGVNTEPCASRRSMIEADGEVSEEELETFALFEQLLA